MHSTAAWIASLLALIAAVAPPPAPQPTAAGNAPATDRSEASIVDRDPIDLALLPGNRALVVNRLGNSVSLVDLARGRIVREFPVGARPFAIAVAADRVVATVRGAHTVAVIDTRSWTVRQVPVGREPRGVAMSSDGRRAWVACSDDDTVAEVDLDRGMVVRRTPVGREPWHVATTPDNRLLAVASPRTREVAVLDTRTLGVVRTVRTAGRNVRRIALDPAGRYAYFPMISERLAPADRVNIDRGWVVGNRLARIDMTKDSPREAVTLDSLGAGVADVDGCAVAPDGSALALAASGSHELVLIEHPARLPFVSYGGPGDHIDPDTRSRTTRIPIAGAPVACRFTADGTGIWISERFGNRLLHVDRRTRRVDRTIALPAPAASPTRLGEAIFHDASRSFGGWYSCASCHVEGHTGGGLFDTLNDGGYGKPKLTPSLRGAARTAPFTWHGWQNRLEDAVGESFVKSMQGPAPSADDVDRVVRWISTLESPASPEPVTPLARSGAVVFRAKGCAQCHAGPDFTSPLRMRVGLESDDDHFEGFNPPSLRNVRQRGPWLHDGRANSLEAVVTEHHSPSKLGIGSDCVPGEVRALVAYLKTL
ncbi:MAG: cytochrome c peroxidase [Armatimonadota bacterium]